VAKKVLLVYDIPNRPLHISYVKHVVTLSIKEPRRHFERSAVRICQTRGRVRALSVDIGRNAAVRRFRMSRMTA